MESDVFYFSIIIVRSPSNGLTQKSLAINLLRDRTIRIGSCIAFCPDFNGIPRISLKDFASFSKIVPTIVGHVFIINIGSKICASGYMVGFCTRWIIPH
jgi:hypothetical protein